MITRLACLYVVFALFSIQVRSQPTQIQSRNAAQDSSNAFKSGIDTIYLNPDRVSSLKMLGEVWGFMKYHHPAIAGGNFNMDAELFKVMHEVIDTHNAKDFNVIFLRWIDKFGSPRPCNQCRISSDSLIHHASYGSLFSSSLLSPEVKGKLAFIRDNINIKKSYYAASTPQGNADFKNELPDSAMKYPDAGFRLLTLFRYGF